MNFPNGFPPDAQARVHAEQLKARTNFQERRKRIPRLPYWPNPQHHLNLKLYVAQVCASFAHEACELGKKGSWTVGEVREHTEHFLCDFFCEAEEHEGHDEEGRRLGSLIGNDWFGACGGDSIRPLVLRQFEGTNHWQQFELELLKLAQAQSAKPAADAPESTCNGPKASVARARCVKKVIEELAAVRPKMHSDADYDSVRDEYSGYLAFKVCDRVPDLKRKLENIQGHQQFKRFAKEIVAAHFGKEYSTIESDWKHHNPDRKPGNPAKQARDGKHRTSRRIPKSTR
jgi:hypothetical protein